MEQQPFRGSAAIRAGLVTRAALRGPGYERLFPDIYLAAGVEPDLLTRSRGALLWAGTGAVLAGYAAAEVYSAHCAPTDTPAELVIPGSHRRPPTGIAVRQDRLRPDEHRIYRDLPVTTPVRTAYDLARRLTLVEAVVTVDALAGRFGFPPSDLLALGERYPKARGRRRLAGVAALAEPLAESTMESRLRLILIFGGLPRPVAQYAVPDRRARIVARIDLAYPERRIAIEYEGADHFTSRRSMADVRRYTRLTDLGWRVYRYRAPDVLGHPERIVDEVRRALSSAAA